MGKIAKLERMRELFNEEQIQFYLDALEREYNIVRNPKTQEEREQVAKEIEELIQGNKINYFFIDLAEMLKGKDYADLTDFAGEGSDGYIDKAMEDTDAEEVELVKGEACMTDSGELVKFDASKAVGNTMKVKLKED